MKAFAKQGADRPDLILTEVPVPEISESELLVRMCAIGVGVHDGYFHPAQVQYPYVIGIEGAGVIEKVGRNASDYTVGERIAFVSSMQPKGGTWAEYAAVGKDSLIIRIPDGMSFEQAAAVPVAGNTALKVFHALNLKLGDSLFIAGASGAIGTFAIQLAVQRGYLVAASASEKNHEYMKRLGAQKTVDYNDPSWPQQILEWQPGGVDAAIAIQPGTAAASMPVVKDGGAIVPVSGDQVWPQRNITPKHLPYQVDVREELTDMMKDIVAGKIQLTIEKVYPFADGLKALQKTQTRRARGKSVLTMG